MTIGLFAYSGERAHTLAVFGRRGGVPDRGGSVCVTNDVCDAMAEVVVAVE